MPRKTRDLWTEITNIEKFIKLPSGKYSKEDDNNIENFIINFRQFLKFVSMENRNDFEDAVKKYRENDDLESLIKISKQLYPYIEKGYKKTRIKRGK